MSRAPKVVTNELYKSGDWLALWVGKLAKSIRGRTTFIDPCAGGNDLFDVLPSPKKAYDKYPIRKGVRKLDFLKSHRRHFVSDGKKQRLTFVMNPPFTMPGIRYSHRSNGNGVVEFLNHAAGIMRDGEVVICVAPQTMRRWVNIAKIDERLHLKREVVFFRPLPFVRKGGRVAKVSVCLQVWKRGKTPRRQPRMLSKSPDFSITMFHGKAKRALFINRWGVSRRVGAISTKVPSKKTGRVVCKVGTLSMQGGTARVILPKSGKFGTVHRRLRKLYSSGKWQRYVEHTCEGNDNPAVVTKDVYTLYTKGLKYLMKSTYGVKVNFVR